MNNLLTIMLLELSSSFKRLATASPLAASVILLIIISLSCAFYLLNKFFGLDAVAAVVGVLTAVFSLISVGQAGKQTARLIRNLAREEPDFSSGYASFNQLRAELALLQAQVIQLGAASAEQLETSREKLLASILSEIGSSGAKNLIDQHRKSQVAQIQEMNIQRTRERLLRETQLLWSFANRNMTIGSVVSVLGMVALFYFLLSAPSIEARSDDAAVSFTKFSIHFLPRATFVIFIEIFAFFFLRLYRNAVTEVKYFQNELTNVELKSIALTAASQADDMALLKTVIEQLASTEKNNIILKAGETTIDLLKEERNLSADRNLTSEIRQLIESFRSGKSGS